MKSLVLSIIVVATAFASSLAVSAPAFSQSLNEAVHLAVKNNPRGRAAEANLRAVASELDESRRTFSPTVDIFGDAAIQKRESPTSTSVNGSGDKQFSREIGVRFSLLLFDGYERANRVYRDAARLDGATYRLLSTSETLALAAVESYIDVVRHRDLVAATQSNIRRHKEILAQIRERVSGGKSPVSDRIQIEERVFAAEAVAFEVENALRDAEAKFKNVIGRMPGKRMRVPGVKGLPKSKNSLVAHSISNNFNIEEANKSISAIGYAKDIAKAGTMPRLSLDGTASRGADRNGTSGSESDLYLGLTLSWRLFDGNQTMARERTAAERQIEAEFNRDTVVRDVSELAEKAWNALAFGRERAGVLRRQLETNKRIVSSYREEYEFSKRSLLDVLDAERARFNNQFQLISASATARFASYRMLATMSRLSRHFGIQPTSIASTPNMEERITESPSAIFDVTIEPLQ